MRLAVFSDVHSNHHALKACLKEAEKQKALLLVVKLFVIAKDRI